MSFFSTRRARPYPPPVSGGWLICAGDSLSDEHSSLNQHPQGQWIAPLAARYGLLHGLAQGRGNGTVGFQAHAVLSGSTIGSIVVDSGGTVVGTGITAAGNVGFTMGDTGGSGSGFVPGTPTITATKVAALPVSTAGSGYVTPLLRMTDGTDPNRSGIGGNWLTQPTVGLYDSRGARIGAFMPTAPTPWTVIVWIGTNDSSGGVSVATFKATYALLLAYFPLLANPPSVVLVGLMNEADGTHPNNYLYSAAIAELALANNLPFVPMGHISSAYFVDGIHPTVAAQTLVVDAISSAWGG